MIPAVTQPVAVPPHDPVGKAMEDPELRDVLLKHALAALARRIGSRPTVDSMDKAREACQEAYTRALQKRDEYNPEFPVANWLHGILNYVLSETVHSLNCSPSQASADPAAWEGIKAALDSDAAETVPCRLDAASYLAKLPSEHKEMIQLRFYEGLAHIEIAARLGISEGNARVRLCRALLAVKMIAGIHLQEDRP